MRIYDTVIMRTPLQSLDMIDAEKKELTELFAEGLILASPEFWTEFQKIEEVSQKERKRLSLSFLKYWLRSCTRCTPYGTFAGTMHVKLTDAPTHISLSEQKDYSRKVRLDMSCIDTLIESFHRNPVVAKQLLFNLNNSFYETPLDYRYAEYNKVNDKKEYILSSVEKSLVISHLLKLLKKSKTFESLVDEIETEFESTREEAEEFVKEIWDSQIIISELEPILTGIDPLQHIIATLSKLNFTEDIVSKLSELDRLLHEPYPICYNDSITILKEFIPLKEDAKNIFQTDLILTSKANSINKNAVKKLMEEVKELMIFFRPATSLLLPDFRNKFFQKFGDKEIDLTLALDVDFGIGYGNLNEASTGGSSWINDIPKIINVSSSASSDYIKEFSLYKYHEYLKEGLSQIEVLEADLQRFKHTNSTQNFPQSLSLMGSLFKKEDSSSNDNFLLSIINISGPSGANILGRFTYDSNIYKLVEEIVLSEENANSEAIFAEVVHLPQARTGNILLRKSLRGYEIPYVGKSSVDDERQLPIDDLTIKVTNDEIILQSKKFKKRVFPRLSTAHNFSNNSLPIYQFLCDLQGQGFSRATLWDWGTLNEHRFLPRVVYKNLILKRARWVLSANELEALENQGTATSYIQKLAYDRGLPERVLYVEGDNQLLIDFKDQNCQQLLIQYLKKRKIVQLEEFLPTENNCIVKDLNNKPYTNEVIIPFDMEAKSNSKVEKPKIYSAKVQTRFAPGSEWLYIKIYASYKLIESNLKFTILPFIEDCERNDEFEKFFFLRYRDDLPHLRLRFYNSDISKNMQLQTKLMSKLHKLLDEGLIDKIVIDTYEREVERYGGDIISACESMFYNDSLAVLKILSQLETNESERDRIFIALKSIDDFLNDFDLSLAEKGELLDEVSNYFFHEFGGGNSLKLILDQKYRNSQKEVFVHLNNETILDQEISSIIPFIENRSEMNKFFVPTLIASKENLGWKKLLGDFIHLFMNRLFIAQHRKYELVVYYYLKKYYASMAAIERKGMTKFR